MRYISELIDSRRDVVRKDSSVVLTGEEIDIRESNNRVNILALGDVGGTVLLGMRLLGEEVIGSIGIYDLDRRVLRRYEREINQVCFADGRRLPRVRIIDEAELFDCNMFVFCASKGVPPVGSGGDTDVRMAQLTANSQLVRMYAGVAVQRGFRGIFAVVSDPVDPLCRAALDEGLKMQQVQGYGLGVMNGRAMYVAESDEEFAVYMDEGRAFGPHGEDLVIADSIVNYDDERSRRLTELAVNSNMVTRSDGFKPYIAPAVSSGAIPLIETLRGGWNYSSVYLGCEDDGAFLGCRNRRLVTGQEIEVMPLDERLFARIESSYRKLSFIGSGRSSEKDYVKDGKYER